MFPHLAALSTSYSTRPYARKSWSVGKLARLFEHETGSLPCSLIKQPPQLLIPPNPMRQRVGVWGKLARLFERETGSLPCSLIQQPPQLLVPPNPMRQRVGVIREALAEEEVVEDRINLPLWPLRPSRLRTSRY